VPEKGFRHNGTTEKAYRVKFLKSKTVELDSIGVILLERSSRARHISISVRPFRGVRVAVPRGVSFDAAEKIAAEKAPWISRHLEKIKAEEPKVRTLPGSVHVNRAKARKKLVRRLDELAVKYGFSYNRVFVRNQKTRWGSCSVKNNINLNVNLVNLPGELLDYVILHELMHTRIRNHGKIFWKELDLLMGDARQLDKELNRYEILPC